MVYFDGTNYYESATDYTPDANVSICVWVMPTAQVGNDKYNIFGSDNKFEAKLIAGEVEQDIWTGTGSTSTGTLTFDTWSHLVITRASNGDCNTYINGALDNYNGGQNTTPATDTMRIGWSMQGATDKRFEGNLEDFRIYDRVLPLDEIQTIYNARGKDFIVNGLKHWLVFDEGYFNQEIATINDRIGSLDVDYQKASTYYPQFKTILNRYKR